MGTIQEMHINPLHTERGKRSGLRLRRRRTRWCPWVCYSWKGGRTRGPQIEVRSPIERMGNGDGEIAASHRKKPKKKKLQIKIFAQGKVKLKRGGRGSELRTP